MKVALLAVGSRGDTQPYVALGVELRARGHEVRVAASALFADLVGEHGLELHPVGGDLSAALADPRVRTAARAAGPLQILRGLRTLGELADAMQPGLYEACRGVDVVVYHPGAAVGYFAARRFGVPSVLAVPFPMVPTRAYPSLIFPRLPPLGGWVNLVSHRIFERGFWAASAGPVRRFWRDRFGELPEGFGNPIPVQRTATRPTILSSSVYVFDVPDDAPAHVHATGYWFLDPPSGWSPSNALTAFLERGDPPVYIGFGSVGDPREAERTTDLVLDALRRAGRRGLLATGWGALRGDRPLPESVFALDEAPHGWLFPRMAAVVHHGGAGTTAAGLRAGVPNLVVPHANDQFAWGRRVHELGVGPAPIPRARLSADALATGIERLFDPELRRAADALGARIRTERGVERAAQVIEAAVEEA